MKNLGRWKHHTSTSQPLESLRDTSREVIECNREEQIWLHIRSVSFTLTFIFYCFCFELRMLPITWDIQESPFSRLWPLRAYHFSIHREIKSCRIEQHLTCWRNRNIMNRSTWTGARTKDSCPKKFATNNHFYFSIKEAWILTEVRQFSRMSTCHLLSLPSFQIMVVIPCPDNSSISQLLGQSCVENKFGLSSKSTRGPLSSACPQEGWCSDWAEMGWKHHRWGFHLLLDSTSLW